MSLAESPPFKEILDCFHEFEEWLPGCLGKVMSFLVDIPTGNEDKLYALANSWGDSAKALSDHQQDIANLADDIFTNLTAGATAEQFQSEWGAYQENIAGLIEQHSSLQEMSQITGITIETTKYLALVDLFTLAMALYAVIMTIIETFGLSSLGGAAAYAVCRTGIMKASEKALEKIAEQEAKTFAKKMAEKLGEKALKKVGEKAAKTAAQRAARKAAREVAEKVGTRAARRAAYHEARNELAGKAVSEIAEDAAAVGARRAAEQVGKKVAEKVGESAAKNAAKKAARQAAREIAAKSAREAAEKAGTKAAEKVAARAARKAGEEAAQRAASTAAKDFLKTAAKRGAMFAGFSVGTDLGIKGVEAIEGHSPEFSVKELGIETVSSFATGALGTPIAHFGTSAASHMFGESFANSASKVVVETGSMVGGTAAVGGLKEAWNNTIAAGHEGWQLEVDWGTELGKAASYGVMGGASGMRHDWNGGLGHGAEAGSHGATADHVLPDGGTTGTRADSTSAGDSGRSGTGRGSGTNSGGGRQGETGQRVPSQRGGTDRSAGGPDGGGPHDHVPSTPGEHGDTAGEHDGTPAEHGGTRPEPAAEGHGQTHPAEAGTGEHRTDTGGAEHRSETHEPAAGHEPRHGDPQVRHESGPHDRPEHGDPARPGHEQDRSTDRAAPDRSENARHDAAAEPGDRAATTTHDPAGPERADQPHAPDRPGQDHAADEAPASHRADPAGPGAQGAHDAASGEHDVGSPRDDAAPGTPQHDTGVDDHGGQHEASGRESEAPLPPDEARPVRLGDHEATPTDRPGTSDAQFLDRVVGDRGAGYGEPLRLTPDRVDAIVRTETKGAERNRLKDLVRDEFTEPDPHGSGEDPRRPKSQEEIDARVRELREQATAERGETAEQRGEHVRDEAAGPERERTERSHPDREAEHAPAGDRGERPADAAHPEETPTEPARTDEVDYGEPLDQRSDAVEEGVAYGRSEPPEPGRSPDDPLHQEDLRRKTAKFADDVLYADLRHFAEHPTAENLMPSMASGELAPNGSLRFHTSVRHGEVAPHKLVDVAYDHGARVLNERHAGDAEGLSSPKKFERMTAHYASLRDRLVAKGVETDLAVLNERIERETDPSARADLEAQRAEAERLQQTFDKTITPHWNRAFGHEITRSQLDRSLDRPGEGWAKPEQGDHQNVAEHYKRGTGHRKCAEVPVLSDRAHHYDRAYDELPPNEREHYDDPAVQREHLGALHDELAADPTVHPSDMGRHAYVAEHLTHSDITAHKIGGDEHGAYRRPCNSCEHAQHALKVTPDHIRLIRHELDLPDLKAENDAGAGPRRLVIPSRDGNLGDYASRLPRHPEAFTVVGHSPDRGHHVEMPVPHPDGGTTSLPIHARELAQLIRESGWHEGEPVLLLTCEGGLGGQPWPGGLAHELAHEMNTDVIAADRPLEISRDGTFAETPHQVGAARAERAIPSGERGDDPFRRISPDGRETPHDIATEMPDAWRPGGLESGHPTARVGDHPTGEPHNERPADSRTSDAAAPEVGSSDHDHDNLYSRDSPRTNQDVFDNGSDVPRTQDVVHDIAALMDISLEGVNVHIVEDAEQIRYLDYQGACACTPPEMGGREIRLGPASFADHETLAATIAHEYTHVEQLRDGRDAGSEGLKLLEEEAYASEDPALDKFRERFGGHDGGQVLDRGGLRPSTEGRPAGVREGPGGRGAEGNDPAGRDDGPRREGTGVGVSESERPTGRADHPAAGTDRSQSSGTEGNADRNLFRGIGGNHPTGEPHGGRPGEPERPGLLRRAMGRLGGLFGRGHPEPPPGTHPGEADRPPEASQYGRWNAPAAGQHGRWDAPLERPQLGGMPEARPHPGHPGVAPHGGFDGPGFGPQGGHPAPPHGGFDRPAFGPQGGHPAPPHGGRPEAPYGGQPTGAPRHQAPRPDPIVGARLAERQDLVLDFERANQFDRLSIRQEILEIDQELTSAGYPAERLEIPRMDQPVHQAPAHDQPGHDLASPHQDAPGWTEGDGRPSIRDLIPRTDAEAAAWQPHIEEAVGRELSGRQYGGLRADLSSVNVGPGHVTVTFDIRHPEYGSGGHTTWEFSRERDGTVVAHFHYLKLSESLHGHGFAKAWHENLEGWFADSGVAHIEVHAAMTVGGYAWARAGYDWAPSPHHAEGCLSRLRAERNLLDQDISQLQSVLGGESPVPAHQVDEILARHGGSDPRAALDNLTRQRDGANDVLDRARRSAFGDRDYPSPFEIAQAGYGGEHGTDATWVGKRAMLGSNWRGIKTIAPSEHFLATAGDHAAGAHLGGDPSPGTPWHGSDPTGGRPAEVAPPPAHETDLAASAREAGGRVFRAGADGTPRYSVELPTDRYAEGAHQIGRGLAARGYEPAHVSNGWRDGGPGGIQGRWTHSATGHEIAVRIDTPESRAAFEAGQEYRGARNRGDHPGTLDDLAGRHRAALLRVHAPRDAGRVDPSSWSERPGQPAGPQHPAMGTDPGGAQHPGQDPYGAQQPGHPDPRGAGPQHWADDSHALVDASDVQATALLREHAEHRVQAGYRFTDDPARVRSAEAIRPEPGTVTIAVEGTPDGHVLIDGYRLTQEQFVREFSRLVDDGTIRIAPGEKIKLVTCYGAQGEHSTAATLAQATGRTVTGATDRVWTHDDGRAEVPDGRWRTFEPSGTETTVTEVRDGPALFEHRDGLPHAAGDPPGSFRGDEGNLHFKGDRPHTFRDAVHPFRLHHEKDAPGTYRVGPKFKLHDEQTGEPVRDPLRGATPTQHRPVAGPRETYQPVHESQDLQGARQRVDEADTPQARRDARGELTRAAGRQVLAERYGIDAADIVAGHTPHTHRGAGELAIAGFDRAGHRLVVLETGAGGRYTLLDGTVTHRGSAEYLGDVLQTDSRLHAHLGEHPELTDALHRALQRGDLTVEHHRIEVDQHGDIRLRKLPTDGLDVRGLAERLPEPTGAADPARGTRVADQAAEVAPALDRTGSPVSVTRHGPDTVEIVSGEGRYRVEVGTHLDRPFEVTLDDHGTPRVRLDGALTDRLPAAEVQHLLGRTMGHADGLVRGTAEGRTGSHDSLVHDPRPVGHGRLSLHDHARLGEFDALARLRDHADGAERARLDAELARFVDDHGLREGTPGEPARRRLAEGELSEVGRRTLDEVRGVEHAGDPAVAEVRRHLTHDTIDKMRTRPVRVPGRDVFKVFPKGWRSQGRVGFSYELRSGEPAGGKVAEFRRTTIDSRHFDLVVDRHADFSDPAVRARFDQVLHDEVAVQHERPPESSQRARDKVINAAPSVAADGAFLGVAATVHNIGMTLKSHITSGLEVLTGNVLRNHTMLSTAERAHDRLLGERLGAPEHAIDGWSDRLNDSRVRLGDLAGEALGDRSVAGHSDFTETQHATEPIPADVAARTREWSTRAMDEVQRDLENEPVEHVKAVRTPGRARTWSYGSEVRRLVVDGGHNIWVEARAGHTADPGRIEVEYSRDRATLRVPPGLHHDVAALHDAVHDALGDIAKRQHRLGVEEMGLISRFTRDAATSGVTAGASVLPGDRIVHGLGEGIGASSGARSVFDALKNRFLGRVEAKLSADRSEFDARNHGGLDSAELGDVATELRDSSRDGRAVTDALHDRFTGHPHEPAPTVPGGQELDVAHRAVEQVNASRDTSGGHWERTGDQAGHDDRSYRARRNALVHARMRIKVGEPAGDGPVEVNRSTLRKWRGVEITVRAGAEPEAIHQAVSHIAENILDRRFHGSKSYWNYLQYSALRGGVQLGGTGVILAVTHSAPAAILGGIAASGHMLRGTLEYAHDIHLANRTLDHTLAGYDPEKVTPALLRTEGELHQRSLENLERHLDLAEEQLAQHRPDEVARYADEFGAHYRPDADLLPTLGADLVGHTDLPHNATIEPVDGSRHTFRVSFRPKLGRPAEFTFDIGTGRAGGEAVGWHRVDSDVTHSILVDPTRSPGEVSGQLHDWVADQVRTEADRPSGTQGAGSRALSVARDSTGQLLSRGTSIVVDVATGGTHTAAKLTADLITQSAYGTSATATSAAGAIGDAHGDVRTDLVQGRAGQLTARHFGSPTEAQLDVLQTRVDARIDRTWQAYDRYQRLRQIADTLPAADRPDLFRDGAAPAPDRGPVVWGHEEPSHGSADPARQPATRSAGSADALRLAQQVERELGRTLYAEPLARNAADAALHRLVDTLQALNKDVPRQKIIDDVIFADDFRNAGQVTGAATLADIHEHGNLRMTMTGFYNGVLESHHTYDLKHSLTRALKAEDWQQRLTAANLDVAKLAPLRERLLASDDANMLDAGVLVGEEGHHKLAVAEHRLSQTARTKERDPAEQFPYLRTRHEYAESGLGLHDAEYAALVKNDKLTLTFQHSEDVPLADLPRRGDGDVDTTHLADRPDVRAVHVEYQRRTDGGFVTDAAGHPVPERVWIEVVDGHGEVNPRVHDLPPGTHGPELPLGWVEGSARYGMKESHDWYQEISGEHGMPVVSGISGTAARLLSALDWLGVPGVRPEEFLHSLLGWMLPHGDHSLYEVLRGAQMVHPAMFGEPGRGFTGVGDMIDRIPGLEGERFDHIFDAADRLPTEPLPPDSSLANADIVRSDDGLVDSNALRRFLDRLPDVPGLSGHPTVPGLTDALRHEGPPDGPGGAERAALHRFAAEALGREPADLRDLEPVGGPGGAKGASGAPVFFVRNEAGARIGVVKVFPKMEEFAREVASIDRLHHENFRDLAVPEVRGVGVARAGDATAGVLVSGVADGRPLDDHLLAVRDSHGADREVALADARDAFHATGRALAEMHNLPEGSGGPVADWFADREGTARIDRMINRWASDPAFQKQFGFDGRALLDRFAALGDQVRAAPGPAALVHGDPHPGNFFFDPATGRVTIIDLEGMHASMDAAGRPVGAAALDAGVFGRVLSAFGHNFDVGPVVPELRTAFEEGYRSAGGHPIPEHALTYYQAGGLALALNGTREVIMGESHPDGVALDRYPARAREQLGELHDLLGLERPKALTDPWADFTAPGRDHIGHALDRAAGRTADDVPPVDHGPAADDRSQDHGGQPQPTEVGHSPSEHPEPLRATVHHPESLASVGDRPLSYEVAVDPSTGRPLPLFRGEPSGEQVSQGALGDCGVVGTIRSVAHHFPEHIRETITPNPDGSFTVRLHEVGDPKDLWDAEAVWKRLEDKDPETDEWIGVWEPTGRTIELTVTPDVPVYDDGTAAFIQQPKNGAAWASLLEKAFAGHDRVWPEPADGQTPQTGYPRLGKGSSVWGDARRLAELTGQATFFREFDPAHPDRLATHLEEALAQNKPILVGTKPVKAGVELPHRLIDAHRYEVVRVQDGQVELKNPWGFRHPEPMSVETFVEHFRPTYATLRDSPGDFGIVADNPTHGTTHAGPESAEVMIRRRDEFVGERFLLIRDGDGTWQLPHATVAHGEHPAEALARSLHGFGLWESHIESLELVGTHGYQDAAGRGHTVLSADITAEPYHRDVHWASRDELLWMAEQGELRSEFGTDPEAGHDPYRDALDSYPHDLPAQDGAAPPGHPGGPHDTEPPDASIDWRVLPEIPEAADPIFQEAHDQAVRAATEQHDYAEQLVGDGKYWFARVYHNVTTNELRMVADGRYDDPLVKLRQVAAFHETYRQNLDGWLAGEHGAVEPNWRRAFTAAESMNGGSWFRPRSLEILKAVLPSLQAHIRFDLPRAIADVYERYYADEGRPLSEFAQDFFDMQPVFDVAAAELSGEIRAQSWPTDPGRLDLAQQVGMRTIFNVPGERTRAWEKALEIVAGHDVGITSQHDMQERLAAYSRHTHPLSGRADHSVDGRQLSDYDWNNQPRRSSAPGKHPPEPPVDHAAPADHGAVGNPRLPHPGSDTAAVGHPAGEAPRLAPDAMVEHPSVPDDTELSGPIGYGPAVQVGTGQPAPLFDGRPVREQAQQGELSDCMVISAMGSVASHRPEAIGHAIHQNPDGTYTVRLHDTRLDATGRGIEPTGRVIELTLTADVPVFTGTGRTAFADQHENGSAWASLLEKGVAGVDATWSAPEQRAASALGYGRLDDGFTTRQQAELLTQLTGERSVVLRLDTSAGSETAVATDWRARLSERKPVLIGFDEPPPGVALPYGLIGCHAYEVVSVDGTGMVQLHNPWGDEHPEPMNIRDLLDIHGLDPLVVTLR